jgi:peroxiredoxin Q/BCP
MASTDSPEDNRGFAEKNEASFPILSDPSKAMPAAYGVLSERGYAQRWTFYIDADGMIIEIDREVDPRTAGEDLVANLEALDVPHAE